MILYCDTSALVKLYIIEAGHHEVHELVRNAEVVAVCRIAWAEACATLARRVREAPGDAPAIAAATRALAVDWPHYLIMDVTQALVEQAVSFADTFALRGYDSVQLAAAHRAATLSGSPITFASLDGRLNRAAKVLGMDAPFAEVP